MPDIKVTIHGLGGGDVTLTGASDASSARKEQYRTNDDTALDRYKYYGTLQAVVTWAPIIIYLTSMRLAGLASASR